MMALLSFQALPCSALSLLVDELGCVAPYIHRIAALLHRHDFCCRTGRTFVRATPTEGANSRQRRACIRSNAAQRRLVPSTHLLRRRR